MNAIEIKPDIYWVGAVDWGIRDFHGYTIQNGTTYNNYLINDKQVTLVDTVKYDYAAVTVDNIKGVVDPGHIQNMIVNHIEPDHAGSITTVMERAPGAMIHITERGKRGLDRQCDTSKCKFKIVKSGDTLNIGRYNLLFIETPMLHWPDSMVTYVTEAKLLISQDAFGQHLATASRFDDEFLTCRSRHELDEAVIDYYANILMPFGKLIKSKIEEIVKRGLEIDMIAPDHGIIWRTHSDEILQSYLDMANSKTSPAVVVIYDTMWQSTELMTIPIVSGIRDAGVDCRVIKLRATPTSFAIKEFFKARGCLIGTPTLNNVMFPSVAEFLHHLGGLRPKDRIMGAFGSFGWGGGAVKEAYDRFSQMGLETVGPGVQVLYKPSADDERQCYEFGKLFGTQMREYHSRF